MLNPDESVLVVVDIQQRLVSAMPDQVAKTTITQTQRLLKAAQILALPIIVTEQYPKGLGSTVTELADCLNDADVVEKTAFSCVNVPAFAERLKSLGRKQIVLTGMESHICILQTALDLLARDFQVYVVEDAVCSRTADNKYNAIQRMRHADIVITNMESTLFEWLADAKHPAFKSLSKLVV